MHFDFIWTFTIIVGGYKSGNLLVSFTSCSLLFAIFLQSLALNNPMCTYHDSCRNDKYAKSNEMIGAHEDD